MKDLTAMFNYQTDAPQKRADMDFDHRDLKVIAEDVRGTSLFCTGARCFTRIFSAGNIG